MCRIQCSCSPVWPGPPALDTTDRSAARFPPTSPATLLHLLCHCLLLGSTSKHGEPHAQSLQFFSSPRGLMHAHCFNRLKVTPWASPALNFAELQTCRCGYLCDFSTWTHKVFRTVRLGLRDSPAPTRPSPDALPLRQSHLWPSLKSPSRVFAFLYPRNPTLSPGMLAGRTPFIYLHWSNGLLVGVRYSCSPNTLSPFSCQISLKLKSDNVPSLKTLHPLFGCLQGLREAASVPCYGLAPFPAALAPWSPAHGPLLRKLCLLTLAQLALSCR